LGARRDDAKGVVRNRGTVPVTRRTRFRALVLVVAALALGLFVTSATARPDVLANVGWGGFGNTPDELRHSPLTQITPGNVNSLGRAFTVDFQKIDSSVRRG
jgi:glucose dehydrogenase